MAHACFYFDTTKCENTLKVQLKGKFLRSDVTSRMCVMRVREEQPMLISAPPTLPCHHSLHWYNFISLFNAVYIHLYVHPTRKVRLANCQVTVVAVSKLETHVDTSLCWRRAMLGIIANSIGRVFFFFFLSRGSFVSILFF